MARRLTAPLWYRILSDVIVFTQLQREDRRIVFYSEGRNYWVHFVGVIKKFLEWSVTPVCYLSSDRNDPGLRFSHSRFKCFYIGEGHIRNWIFENIDTEVMVMTMPDLDQYQIKRSIHNVHYVYLQHSLLSLHMVYRTGAFDSFDTIFCSGPFHRDEVRALEKQRGTPAKLLFNHGYGRLDALIEDARLNNKVRNQIQYVLLAPSWGPNGVIETMGGKIVDTLLSAGYHVTLRPHPETIKSSMEIITSILVKHENEPRFKYEGSVDGQDSLMNSDLMISDWSGAALEFALGLKKPVLFIDVPRKLNNPDYAEIEIEPIEVSMRGQIGQVVGLSEVEDLGRIIGELQFDDIDEAYLDSKVYNVGNSDVVGAKKLAEMLTQSRLD